jgi:hypothetical protein
MFVTGIFSIIVGALDPMEGSVVILLGSILLAISSHFLQDRHRKIFLAFFLCILIGIVSLFTISDFGGLGQGYLSWWWGLLILPYPIGWLSLITLLIIRTIKKK